VLHALWMGEVLKLDAKGFAEVYSLHAPSGVRGVPDWVVTDLATEGLIERGSKHPYGKRFFEFQLTDAGLKHLGKPTKAEATKVELVNGPDVRKAKRGKR
jgi:hypothetical protein